MKSPDGLTDEQWHVECFSGDAIEIQASDGETVCVMGEGRLRIERAELIASSPRMLKMLEKIKLFFFDGYSTDRQALYGELLVILRDAGSSLVPKPESEEEPF